MKRRNTITSIMISAAMIIGAIPLGNANAEGLAINSFNFPDPVLLDAVSQYDTNDDDMLDSTEMSACESLDLSDSGLYDASGVELLSNLKTLNLSNNNLMSFEIHSIFDSIETLDLSSCNLFSIDIELCPNLTELNVSYNSLSSIYFGGNTNLTNLICNNCGDISEVNLSNLSSLEKVTITGHFNLNAINFEGCSGIRELNIRSNGITSLDISDCSSLVQADISGNKITDFTVGNNSNLESLFCYSNQLTTLDLSSLTNLKELQCNANQLTSLNLTGCTKLEALACGYNSNLGNINLNMFPELAILEADGIGLSSIDLSNNTKLETAFISDNNLTSIDLSHNPELQVVMLNDNNLNSISLVNNQKLTHLIVYNNNLNSIDVTNNPLLDVLCIEGNNITTLDIHGCSELLHAYSLTPVINSRNAVEHQVEVPEIGAYKPFSYDQGTQIVVSVAPTVTPAVTPTPEGGVAGFVERLYTIALERPSDSNGKADWINRVYTQGATGADLAFGFLYSPEFLNKEMTNSEFLDVLYRVFFDREADSLGKSDWLSRMAGGLSKQEVILGFINSTEWANVCLRFGINSGGNGVANITINPSPEIIAFATRLYTMCLGRGADVAGLEYWSYRIANRQISGSEAAYGFFFSEEFVGNSNIDNAEFINRLYRTFMNREADSAGFNDWMNRLKNGASREEVFNGFAGSGEWADICSSYAILK